MIFRSIAMEKPVLSIIKRKNSEGVKCIAPFINGQNLWDIEEKRWRDDVQKAILIAYAQGLKDAKKQYDKVEILGWTSLINEEFEESLGVI